MAKYHNTPTEGGIFDVFGTYGRMPSEGYRLFYGHFIEGVDQKTVMDLGCGFGSDFILFLKEEGYRPKKTIHIDANPLVFKRQAKYGLRQDLLYDWDNDLRLAADANDLPLADESVDIAHHKEMFSDIEHLINRERVFQEVHRVLRPGGVYIFQESCDDGPTERDGFKLLSDPDSTCPVYLRI